MVVPYKTTNQHQAFCTLTALLLVSLLTHSTAQQARLVCPSDCKNCNKEQNSLVNCPLSIPTSQLCSQLGSLHHLQLTGVEKDRNDKLLGNETWDALSRWLQCSPSVRRLELRGVDLQNMHKQRQLCRIFTKLPRLTELSISAGNLTQFDCLSSGVVAISIQSLNLSYNQLEKVSISDILTTFPSLRNLDLSYNPQLSLHNTRPQIDGGGPALALLLRGFPAVKLTQNTLPTIPNLAFLDLSQNDKLREIGPSAFLGFPRLTTLRLANCSRLSKIDPRTFDPVSGSLTHIDLTGSSTLGRYLDLTESRSLRRLQLNDTGLAGLRLPAALPPLQDGILEHLELARTSQWNCSCDILWLSSFLPSFTDGDNNSSITTATCASPPNLRGQSLSQAISSLLSGQSPQCSPPQLHNCSLEAHRGFRVTGEVVIQCFVEGFPIPDLYWTTPIGEKKIFRHTRNSIYPELLHTGSRQFHSRHHWHFSTDEYMIGIGPRRLYILANQGALYIDYLTREDPGYYQVQAVSPLGNATHQLRLILDPAVLFSVRNHSLFIGLGSSVAMLIIGLTLGVSRYISSRCSREEQAKRQSLRQLLESVAAYRVTKTDKFRAYRHRQMDQIRGNCNSQVTRIKELCTSYGVTMQDNYNRRIAKMKENCELRVKRLHDSYTNQRARIKDYRQGQVDRLRDNYQAQVLKIREYTASQVEKLREQYRLQQQYMTKLIEVVSLESCMLPGMEVEVVDEEAVGTDDILIPDFPDVNEDEDEDERNFPEELCHVEVSMERSPSQDSDDFVTACSDSEEDDETTVAASGLLSGTTKVVVIVENGVHVDQMEEEKKRSSFDV